MLRVRLLGAFQVAVNDCVIPDTAWRRRKAAAVVKLLALAADHRLHRDQLMELLWPEVDPEQAANNLYQALHAARRALSEAGGADVPLLESRDQELRLAPATPCWVDVEAFEHAAAIARRQRNTASYEAALDLYGGDLLPADRYEDWASERRVALQRTRLDLLAELAGLLESQDELRRAIEVAQQLLAADPSHEDAHRLLMRLYARTGQRQQALRQYQTLSDMLSAEFGIEPEAASQALHRQILAGGIATVTPVNSSTPRDDHSHHNLPAPISRFIGREREKRDIGSLLATSRLTSLIGPGGAGKTRLAYEVATQAVPHFRDGVWVVELASLADPALLPHVVTTALRIREAPGQPIIDTLMSTLRPRSMLLVLDNCEHLIDACASFAESLLRSCPELRILTTSREPLRLDGEITWLVPSMSLPDPSSDLTPAQAGAYEAIALFVERATAASPGFALSDENTSAVVTLCRRLDGMPLAIELAAARTRSLSVRQIVDRLDDRFRLLTGGSRTAVTRQQTLRAALDWSHDLLSEPERALFARLSVFAGGFGLDAAERVGAGELVDENEVIDLLAQLVERSLVITAEQDGRSRYFLLETMRAYGRERLEQRGETATMRERHAAFFLEMAEEADRRLRGLEQNAWIRTLDAEHDNLRAALEWCERQARDGLSQPGLRLAGSLHWYWQLAGHISEGRDWLARFIAHSEGQETRERAYVLTGAGWLAVACGEYKTQGVLFDEAIRISRELGDERVLALALLWSTWMAVFRGSLDDARRRVEESRAIFTRLGDAWGVAIAHLGAGFIDAEAGDLEQGEQHFRKSLGMLMGLHDAWGIVTTQQVLAHVMYRRGEYAAARSRAEDVLDMVQHTHDRWMQVQTLTLLGEIARAQGDYDTASVVCEESLTLSREIGHRAVTAWTLRDLGYIALARGDVPAATADFHEGLSFFHEHDYPLGVACCLAGLAAVAHAQSQSDAAARLLGVVESLLEQLNMTLAPADHQEIARTTAAVREALGEQAWAESSHLGRSLSLDEAIVLLQRLPDD